jgi:hypothetical protein
MVAPVLLWRGADRGVAAMLGLRWRPRAFLITMQPCFA